MMEIVLAYDSLDEVKVLFSEYTNMLMGMSPDIAGCLKNQDYDAELDHLEEKYGLPDGRLYLAKVSGRTAGCIGLRRLNETECEMKRVYVRPGFRGLGVANRMVEKVLTDARVIGYQAMLLDTMPYLQGAIRLYEKFGFYQVGAYNDNPLVESVFMRVDL